MAAGSSPTTTWSAAIEPSPESHEVGSIPQQLRPFMVMCFRSKAQGLHSTWHSRPSLHDLYAKSMEGKLFLGNVPVEASEEDLRGIFCAIEGLTEAREACP